MPFWFEVVTVKFNLLQTVLNFYRLLWEFYIEIIQIYWMNLIAMQSFLYFVSYHLNAYYDNT